MNTARRTQFVWSTGRPCDDVCLCTITNQIYYLLFSRFRCSLIALLMPCVASHKHILSYIIILFVSSARCCRNNLLCAQMCVTASAQYPVFCTVAFVYFSIFQSVFERTHNCNFSSSPSATSTSSSSSWFLLVAAVSRHRCRTLQASHYLSFIFGKRVDRQTTHMYLPFFCGRSPAATTACP